MSRVNVCVAEILRVDFLRVQDTNTHGHGNHSVRDQTKLNVAGVSFRGRIMKKYIRVQNTHAQDMVTVRVRNKRARNPNGT